VNILVTNTKLCVSDRSSSISEPSLCHPKHSELDCYVNEVIQLRQVICLYTKSYCPLKSLQKTHTIGCITLFITLNITHVCQISHLIFVKKNYFALQTNLLRIIKLMKAGFYEGEWIEQRKQS
jgi:hypothetical protein